MVEIHATAREVSLGAPMGQDQCPGAQAPATPQRCSCPAHMHAGWVFEAQVRVQVQIGLVLWGFPEPLLRSTPQQRTKLSPESEAMLRMYQPSSMRGGPIGCSEGSAPHCPQS